MSARRVQPAAHTTQPHSLSMSALDKLAVDSDTGTTTSCCRPATGVRAAAHHGQRSRPVAANDALLLAESLLGLGLSTAAGVPPLQLQQLQQQLQQQQQQLQQQHTGHTHSAKSVHQRSVLAALQQQRQQPTQQQPQPAASSSNQRSRFAVVPHVTRPHRGLAVLPPPPQQQQHWQQGAGDGRGGAPHASPQPRPSTAFGSLQHASGRSCHAGVQPHTPAAAELRPGSAAAARLLRVLARPSGCSQLPRPAACAVQPSRCSTAGGCTTASSSSDSRPLAERPQQQQHQAAGGSSCASSRPSTAVMRAVLAAATAGLQDGVEERLSEIRNGAASGEGLDIVHEEEGELAAAALEEGAPPPERQAAAMVLNLETLSWSTAEVLQLELEHQLASLDLASLDLAQLRQLHDALM